MFAGRFDHALDDKGRTMLPRRFRERMSATSDRSVWVTRALDGGMNHLEARPDTAFRAYQARISALPQTAMIKEIKRLTVGMAHEIEVDAAGRLLIPVSLRKDFGLADRITFVGADENYFEIWNPDTLDGSIATTVADPAALLAHLAELGL